MSDNDPSIPAGDIAFFDNYLPSIHDGVYTISISTGIHEDIGANNYFALPVTQDFEIRGPQFSVPATDVHSVYPPSNSNSVYDSFLPNIVLNKRVLPWERYFDKDDQTIPWLCLLVFKEGEIAVDPKTNSSLITGTVRDFLAKSGDTLKPDIPLDSIAADVLAQPCSHIRLPAATFRALAPKVGELKYLAHVRQVPIDNQAIDDADEPGWFSVVAGNRFLLSSTDGGERYYIHLVSVEGYFGIMSGTTPWPKKEGSGEDKDIALASLANWTFLSQPENLNFTKLVENFVTQAGGDGDNLLLRKPVPALTDPDPPVQKVLNRLKDGYVPLNYQTPTGEATFAWYRGPFTPVIAQPLPSPSPSPSPLVEHVFPTASSMMIYDKETGVFDQSYAAAWSMGRALALADGTFSQALMTYRRTSYALVGQLMDALESVGDTTPADLSAVVESSVVLDTVKSLIVADTRARMAAISLGAVRGERLREAAPVRADKPSPVQVARDFLAAVPVQTMLRNEVENDLLPVARWIAERQLLYGVPFNHLVPDPAMLPVESLRFYYLDQNWLDALTDGALSIGVQSSKDSFYNGVTKGIIADAIAAEVRLYRSRLLGKATGDKEADSPQEAMCGILIRSAIVAGWPGLVVKGFKGGDFETGEELKLLRMERLSSSVLLCIFLDIPDTIMLAEPQQGLCFGVGDDGRIHLRTPSGKQTGTLFPQTGTFQDFYRSALHTVGEGVLNINDGTGSVVQSLGKSLGLESPPTPAGFALQVVKAPDEISFKAKG